MPSNSNEDKAVDLDDSIDNSDNHSDTVTDTTGYSSDEDLMMSNAGFSVRNPMIVVSNRLPFVLKRNENGELIRKSRYV